MIIDCISDLHGFEPQLPGGELLIIAGDLTESDRPIQYGQFSSWLERQKYEKKVLISGNHDSFFEKSGFEKIQDSYKDVGIDYLCDSGTEYKGLKIWGTPWTPWFDGVNPKCKAFMDSEIYLEKRFSLIPNNLDILITHGPMLHILDANYDGYACGSKALRGAVDRARPRFLVCGHIHEQGNNQLMYKHTGTYTWCINCSHVNEVYEPINKPIRIII